jgi:hypothetical protein
MQVPPIPLIKSCTVLVNVQLLTGLSIDWRTNYVYGIKPVTTTSTETYSSTTTTACSYTSPTTSEATAGTTSTDGDWSTCTCCS